MQKIILIIGATLILSGTVPDKPKVTQQTVCPATGPCYVVEVVKAL